MSGNYPYRVIADLISINKFKYVIIGIFILFILAYLLKYKMGLDFLSSVHLSNHFPFKYLVTDVIKPSRSGILFSESFDREYFFRLFYSNEFRDQFIVEAHGITRFGLSTYAFNSAFIPLPSIYEQKAIAKYLNRKTRQIDELIENNKNSILLMEEYRTTLISEVVTGKIDIRKDENGNKNENTEIFC